jgi:uncharacterized protein
MAAVSGTEDMGIDPELVAKLACPACPERPPVRMGEGAFVWCTRCGRRYPYRDGVLVMLPEEAELPSGTPEPSA